MVFYISKSNLNYFSGQSVILETLGDKVNYLETSHWQIVIYPKTFNFLIESLLENCFYTRCF